jgi:quercetin dioxygenase-like cupin family protein
LAHRGGFRCERRAGVVGVHQQYRKRRTDHPNDDSNGARGVCRNTVAEKTVTELPAGPLYWHVENFPALADAEAAAGPLSLATDVEGKVWLFTLGPKGTPTHGGSMVAEIGPLVDVSAPEYMLRISHGVAAPGAKSGVHTHPGTEAFFVLEGQLSQQTPHGVNVVEAGKTLAGGPAEHPMEVTSSGGEELHWLIMFVVDANKPFASEATFE